MVADVRVSCINNSDRINPRQRVTPVYPPDAVARRVEDVVIIEFMVAADGKVTEPRVVRSVPALDHAAISAVRQWVFKVPETLGVVLQERQTVAVQFSLL